MVNLAALALFSVVVWAAQCLALHPLLAYPPLDAALLLFIITVATFALALSVSALTAAVSRLGRPWLDAVVWSFLLIGAAVIACDALSYSWLRLHLDDSMQMLYWYVRANPVGIASKLAGLVAGVVLIVGAAIASAMATHMLARRARRLMWRTTPMRFAALWAVALIAWGASEAFAARAMSASGFEARTSALALPRLAESMRDRGGEELFSIDSPRLRQLPAVSQGRERLDRITPSSVTKPLNVFIFVVESLRADMLSPETMPALTARRPQALSGVQPVAAGNCTHVSWTALLHGVNPLYWTVKLHQAGHGGAVPLIALRRAGYRVHAFSSYELNYFGSDLALFGADRALADEVRGQRALGASRPGANVAELDAAVVEEVQARAAVDGATGRNVYLGFLGALHHGYEWPNTFRPVFEPFLPLAELTMGGMRPQNAELLRARYKNAARFTDGLFEQFFAFLDTSGLRENSIVVVAGDHGEEFMEEGHLVHSSALNRYQLETPILIFLPDGTRGMPMPPLVSHADVFPTVLQELGLYAGVSDLMTGTPLQDATAARSAISAGCSTATPQRLLVQTPSSKLVIELEGIQKRGFAIFARRLRGVALLDEDYRPMDPSLGLPALDRPDLRNALSAFVTLPGR
ncbi:MAG: sulfatase-like hydrolase/transferase [Acidobacteriota bacterium]|nr:sulfatase-like hydrolase/transferase [Acidobacteriota bacterium]